VRFGDSNIMLPINRRTWLYLWWQPIAAAVAIEAIKIVHDEKLAITRKRWRNISSRNGKTTQSMIEEIRGERPSECHHIRPIKEKQLGCCLSMWKKGVIAKPTHET
jgi:hypothetical protein